MPVRFEEAVGTKNGVNVDFKTPRDPLAGTIRAWTPTAQTPAFVTELTGRDFQLEDPPLADDVILVQYESIS